MLGDLAQASDRLTDDARDLHLADTEDLTDLGLREILLKAQAQDLARSSRQSGHETVEQYPHLGLLVPAVVGAERVLQRALVAVGGGCLQRCRLASTPSLQRFEDLLVGRAELGRELGDGRRTVKPDRESAQGLFD